MKIDVNTWKSRFFDLSPMNQLLIAQAIVDELEFNNGDVEEYGNEDEYTGYDIEKAVSVVDAIQTYIYTSEQINKKRSQLKKQKDILNNFKNLPDNVKNKITKDIVYEIEQKTDNYYEQEKVRICQEEGHKFGNWYKDVRELAPTYHEHETARLVLDESRNVIREIPETVITKEEHVKITWNRTCKKCNYTQRVDTYEEAQELSRKRVPNKNNSNKQD